MNELQIAHRVKQLLNRGLSLDSEKLSRLKAARDDALAHQRVQARSPIFAWADNVVGTWGQPSFLLPRVLLPTALLVFGLVAINQWRETQVAAEIEEIDAAMLTGDLPLDAYLDKGFDTWLRRTSR